MTYYTRLILISSLFLSFSVSESIAQRAFGVNWEIPDRTQDAISELRQLRELGISVLEINESPEDAVWREINDLQFEVFGQLEIIYPLTSTFAQRDSTMIAYIEQQASAYIAQPSVRALGVFEFGAIHRHDFLEAVAPYLSQLQKAGREVYFLTGRNVPGRLTGADFYILHIDPTPGEITLQINIDDPDIGAYRYAPRGQLQEMLSPLRSLLGETSAYPQKPVIFESEWLFNILETHPRFATTLQSLAINEDTVFPVPKEDLPEQNQSVLPIIFLIIAWGIIALLYHNSPLYRKSLFRYFVGHKFFIKDIFGRQIRSPMPALTIILLNALLIAASTFAAFQALLSPLGQDAFLYYFPVAPAAPASVFVFITVTVGVLLLALVSTLWLFLTHRSIQSITQIVIIYAWPLQLNILTTTIAITLFSAEAAPYWIAIFTGISYIILLLSFILASLDAAKHSRKKSSWYLALTSGIYLLLLIALGSWLIAGERWWEITDLLLAL